MRLSTDPDRDEERARQTIAAALDAGITVFDTARAYGRDETELGHNERLLAAALREIEGGRIVTKGGMTRPAGAWIPDGRAKSILADCEASLAALDGLPIDLYLIHAPDRRTPWPTSVRALARLFDQRMVSRVGLSNVNRRQLDEATELAPIAAVEVALSIDDDRALRGGIVERCAELGIAVLAHSPLGGPRRAAGLGRRSQELAVVGHALDATPAQIALAWLLDLAPNVVPIPGARRPETARSAARAAALADNPETAAVLRNALGAGRRSQRVQAAPATTDSGDVVLVMGIPGAGKSLIASDYLARGYVRLNRDERGGALRELAQALDETLTQGARRVVLDNTYLSRAARSHVIETASRHGIRTRCHWLDTPLAQAQVNLVERMLDAFGTLPTPGEVRGLARSHPGVLAPTSQMRTARELEPPSLDEGFADVETIAFVRRPAPDRARAGVFVAASALERPGWERALDDGDRTAPHLLFHWSPGDTPDSLDPARARIAAEIDGPVEAALCPHPGGPPVCWCRPPLPGLPLAFARTRQVDPARSVLIGTGPAHRTLATALGARYVPVSNCGRDRTTR